MHRHHRLTDIIRVLRSKRLSSAEELAERFNVSPRTIYRDVAELHRLGVPVIGEAGVGYYLDRQARLEAVRFTAIELEAMLQSARLALRSATPAAAESIHRALAKLEAALPLPLVEALTPLDEVANDPEPAADLSAAG
ncbi:MAG: HTH domain-containing protein, partial [Myxococcales bacterium]|nr:HTH domain-containing protein [Myxococcales bacterium]